jgi:hypothetical protein
VSQVAIAAALVGVLAAAGANGWRLIRDRGSDPATTISFNLAPDQKEVPLQTQLIVRSSRPVAPAAFVRAFKLQPAAQGTVTASSNHLAFSWRPAKPLAELTTYALRISGLQDAAGRGVRPARWTFTTTLVPRVQAAVAQGQPLADGAEIPLGAPLQLTFNTQMEPASIALVGNGAGLTLHWADDHKSAAVDTNVLRAGPLQLSLAAGGKDSQGRPLADWKMSASIYWHADVHTTPLRVPALIQIPNDPSARDQSGVQAANLVFESVAEGGITRFTALFTNLPDQVGPVRSGRLISFKLARHYHGMLFASGLSQGSNAVLSSDPVPHQFDTPGWYYRTGFPRFAPNNLFIHSDRVVAAQAQVADYALPAGPVSPLAGAAAPHVDVPVHQSTYDYDQQSATYRKTEEGHLMADAATGQPLHIQMLIVLHTTVTVTGIIEDSNNAHGLDYGLDGSGTAEFYFDGQKATGSWSSADRGSPLSFKLDTGSELNLPAHGLVWIDVVP